MRMRLVTFANSTEYTPDLDSIEDLHTLRDRVYKWRTRVNAPGAAWMVKSPKMMERYMSECKPQTVSDHYFRIAGAFTRTSRFDERDPLAKFEIENLIGCLTVLKGLLLHRRSLKLGQNGSATGLPDPGTNSEARKV